VPSSITTIIQITTAIQAQVLDDSIFPCWVTLYSYSLSFCHINSYNRFKPLERQLAVNIGRSNLRELRLNSCRLTWDQVSLFLTVSWAYHLAISSLQFIAMHCSDWHLLTDYWQVLMVAPAFPSLRSLELGLCQLNNLEVASPTLVAAGGKSHLPLLESLNFDTNNLSDWVGVCKGVKIFPRCVISSLSGISPSNQTEVLTLE
jgi:Leucine-rich repeat (LRR) protein